MIAFQSSVPALPLGAIDTGSVIIVAMVAGAVALVLWASRPSVISRYSVDSARSGTAQESPAQPFAPEEKGREA